MPPLNVVMLLVGTLGDLLPFMAIARRMEQEHGHTVRIATHEVHRERVRAHGLRFYPLAGDPVELSEWAQTFSCAPTDLVECCAHPQLTAAKASMQRDICFSTWPACTAADEESGEPFQADAIIANPPTYGHIHCAERLGVPLHLMFPQPWVATRAFPHPFSGVPVGWWREWNSANWMTYAVVDAVLQARLHPALP